MSLRILVGVKRVVDFAVKVDLEFLFSMKRFFFKNIF